MSKLKLALLLTMLLALVVSVATFAGGFKVVKYEDTSAKIKQPTKSVTTPQYIYNGDFMYWKDGKPVGWHVPDPVLTPGWSVHFANVDLTAAGTQEGGSPPLPAEAMPPAKEGEKDGPKKEMPDPPGYNPGAGLFFRTGASGSQYAGMSQQVSHELMDGKYWVQVHITAWEHNVKSEYNSVAWYGFGHSPDPSSVHEWRELFPDSRVCANDDAKCNYLGRKEGVFIRQGDFLHLWMGMKFPDHNAWSVFVVDDISISDFSDGINVDITDFVDDGDVYWDPRAER
jgi:hypothetical protein